MILLLSGTSEGRLLSARLRGEGLPFVASVTTPEARQLFATLDPAPEILVTRFSGDALRGQHVLDGAGGELVVVLDATEALLLRGRHQHAVADEGGRRVVEEAGDPEDVHA